MLAWKHLLKSLNVHRVEETLQGQVARLIDESVKCPFKILSFRNKRKTSKTFGTIFVYLNKLINANFY